MGDGQQSACKFISYEPFFLVADVKKAAEYYRDVLGFEYDQLWGDPPFFCRPERDGYTFMLRQVEDKSVVRPNSVACDTWDAYIKVTDADALFEEFKSRGANVDYEPETMEGMDVKHFGIKDVDGYLLGFGQEGTTGD